MKVTVSESGPCKRIMEVEIPVEKMKEEFERKIGSYQKTAQIRGFRPGKVPREMIHKRYGEEILGMTAEDMIGKTYEEACRDKELVPVSRASISDVDYGAEKPLKFKAEFEIEPFLELKKYTGLGMKMDKVQVGAKDVDQMVEDLRERLASYDKVERVSQKGDYVRYTYEKVVVDGTERSDYKNPSYPVPIGEAKIKEFNKALVGVKAGDEVVVEFRFPKDYEAEEVRGKDGVFTLKINELMEKKLPEPDDAFAQKVGQYENVEAMRRRIEEDLLTNRTREAKRKVQEEIINGIIDKNEIIIPNSRVESYAENMFKEMSSYQKDISKDEVMGRYRELALREIRKYKILEWVAKTEGIKATSEEVDEKIRGVAQAQNQDFEKTKEEMRQKGTTLMIRSDIREEKTMNWLIEKNQK